MPGGWEAGAWVETAWQADSWEGCAAAVVVEHHSGGGWYVRSTPLDVKKFLVKRVAGGSVAEVVIAAEGRGRRLAQGGAIAAAALLETHGQGQKSSSGASLAEALDLASEGYGVADDLEALLLAYARQQVRISVI